MAERTLEEIFNDKNQLHDFFPASSDTKVYDVQRKHFLYGKIDRDGDAVYIEETYLAQIDAGELVTEFAVDFVADAFDDFKRYYTRRVQAGFLDKESQYGLTLLAKRGWSHGQLDFNYYQYTNRLYADFVQNYLEQDRRYEKVKDFSPFVREFINYASPQARRFPITKTGFLLSIHSSPYVSGLAIDLADAPFGESMESNALKFTSDPNFPFMVNTAKRFGFLIDKNAPWRLVFNLASGNLATGDQKGKAGGSKYLQDRNVNFDNIFSVYFVKSYKQELLNMKKLLLSYYDAFHAQFPDYQVLRQVMPKGDSCKTVSEYSAEQSYTRKKVLSFTNQRDLPPLTLNTDDYDEYIMKAILRFRMLETEHPDFNDNFIRASKEMIDTKRVFGVDAGLKYINDFTKGWRVSKFLRKGKYWYGQSDQEYNARKRQILENQ